VGGKPVRGSRAPHDAVPDALKKVPVSKRNRRQRGQSIVELALVIPVFLVLVFGIIDFGLGLRAWITVTNSAREGARIGAVHGTCDEIREQVKATSGGLVTSDEQITIDPPTCVWTPGNPVKVTVTYEYNFVTPLAGVLDLLPGETGLGSSLDISSASNMRVE
jgi:Flp pilus assembly protein TadG